jgi:hypothetical protein
VFTARYALSPYTEQIRFFFEGLMCDPVFDKAKFFQVTIADERMFTVNSYLVPVNCRT